jgi:hypothetical protein
MSTTVMSDCRLPFVPHDCFLETAFEQRFQGVIRRAWQQRSWHVIAAIPGRQGFG